MIHRKTVLAVAHLYQSGFVTRNYGYNAGVYSDHLYEFFYERDYPPWLTTKARNVRSSNDIRDLFVEIAEKVSPERDNPQELLRRAAEDVLNLHPQRFPAGPYQSQAKKELERALELDGYVYRDTRVLRSESEALEIEEEQTELTSLYKGLGLGNLELVLQHLKDSEDRYRAGHWGDAIGNARDYMEEVLEQIALAISHRQGQQPLSEEKAERAVIVRTYLEKAQFFTRKEPAWWTQSIRS